MWRIVWSIEREILDGSDFWWDVIVFLKITIKSMEIVRILWNTKYVMYDKELWSYIRSMILFGLLTND